MLRVILTKGLPGSGKTTWAKQLQNEQPHVYKRINKDDLRSMLDAGHWSKKNERFLLRLEEHMILEALKEGKHVILDNTHIEGAHFQRIENLLKDNGFAGKAKIEIKDFTDVSLEECIKRDLQRPNSVGEHVIKRMHKKLKGPMDRVQKLREFDPSLPCAWIIDVDGTLALMNGRSPYEWNRVGEDKPNRDVVDFVLRHLIPSDGYIIVVSGRDSVCRVQTIDWLYEHGILFNELLMRPEGDVRKDTVVKQEIYEQFIKDRYNVLGVLDDRKSVCQMWREQGLTVFQVAEGDF